MKQIVLLVLVVLGLAFGQPTISDKATTADEVVYKFDWSKYQPSYRSPSEVSNLSEEYKLYVLQNLFTDLNNGICESNEPNCIKQEALDALFFLTDNMCVEVQGDQLPGGPVGTWQGRPTTVRARDYATRNELFELLGEFASNVLLGNCFAGAFASSEQMLAAMDATQTLRSELSQAQEHLLQKIRQLEAAGQEGKEQILAQLNFAREDLVSLVLANRELESEQKTLMQRILALETNMWVPISENTYMLGMKNLKSGEVIMIEPVKEIDFTAIDAMIADLQSQTSLLRDQVGTNTADIESLKSRPAIQINVNATSGYCNGPKTYVVVGGVKTAAITIVNSPELLLCFEAISFVVGTGWGITAPEVQPENEAVLLLKLVDWKGNFVVDVKISALWDYTTGQAHWKVVPGEGYTIE